MRDSGWFSCTFDNFFKEKHLNFFVTLNCRHQLLHFIQEETYLKNLKCFGSDKPESRPTLVTVFLLHRSTHMLNGEE